MKNNVKAILTPIIVLTLISAVMAALLGGTDLLTKDRIARFQEKAEFEAVEKVIAAENYEKMALNFNGAQKNYYKATANNKCVGYAFTVSANGYGGTVTVVVGIDTDGIITAVEITDVSNETPGLGQNAKSEEFTHQFSKKTGDLSVVKCEAKDNEIQAITGATITSKAVTKAVNEATKMYEQIAKEGK